MIDLTGMDKADVLARLYNASSPQGMGWLHAKAEPMGIDKARSLLERGAYFDYLHGRVMKVNLAGDQLNPALYDRDNGQGAALKAISG